MDKSKLESLIKVAGRSMNTLGGIAGRGRGRSRSWANSSANVVFSVVCDAMLSGDWVTEDEIEIAGSEVLSVTFRNKGTVRSLIAKGLLKEVVFSRKQKTYITLSSECVVGCLDKLKRQVDWTRGMPASSERDGDLKILGEHVKKFSALYSWLKQRHKLDSEA